MSSLYSISLSPDEATKTTCSPSSDHDGEYESSGPSLVWVAPSGAMANTPETPCLSLYFENAILPSSPGKAASAEVAAKASMIADNNNAAPRAPRTPNSLEVPTLAAFRRGTA